MLALSLSCFLLFAVALCQNGCYLNGQFYNYGQQFIAGPELCSCQYDGTIDCFQVNAGGTSSWGNWGAWSSCSKPCGGTRTRHRTCHGGGCSGSSSQTSTCSTQACGEKY
ncbi:hypothetical protein BaRGS_00030072 [Batillaria attramentaria]|uniref:Uncharacterized protein n=1 Tax=Batillaria attramentaria TaxID=370345 RepID=A0ABD0JUG1_9CAEN